MKQLISVGDLIDQSWNKYRSALPFFLQISGWFVIIAIVNTIALLLYPSAGVLAYHPSLTSGEITGIILYALSNAILTPFLGFWIFVALAVGAKAVITNRSLSIKDVMKETNKSFLPTLSVTVLIGLTLLFAQIITIGPSIILGSIGLWIQNVWVLGIANILLIIGLFTSVILTLRWTLYYIMAPYASIIDHNKNKQALLKSRELIKGKFWSVLFRVVLPKIVFVLFGIVIAFLISTILRTIIIGSTGLNLEVQQRIDNLVTSILPILIMIFLNPLIFLSDVLLYQSLTENQE